jgi:hypothetical protein
MTCDGLCVMFNSHGLYYTSSYTYACSVVICVVACRRLVAAMCTYTRNTEQVFRIACSYTTTALHYCTSESEQSECWHGATIPGWVHGIVDASDISVSPLTMHAEFTATCADWWQPEFITGRAQCHANDSSASDIDMRQVTSDTCQWDGMKMSCDSFVTTICNGNNP